MLDKIFFFDGCLDDLGEFEVEDKIDARYGYTNNMECLEKLLRDTKKHMILTNQTALLNNELAWNSTTHEPDIYLIDKSDGKWKNISRFTKTGLSFKHNLERLYRSGEFVVDKAYKDKVPKPRGLVKYNVK